MEEHVKDYNHINSRSDARDKILLVEDEPSNMRVLTSYLQRAGYLVDGVGDGEAAWRKLTAESNYDVVVTDRRMPQLDGLDLFKRIIADPGLRNIPVIMQTGASSPSEVVEGIDAGVYYYLTKPYQEEALVALVKAAIREHRQNDIFGQRLTRQQDALSTAFVKGAFHLRTVEEAENVAFLLGSLFPRPKLAVSGLYELLLNAIEHGNLAIGYETKAALLASSQWEGEVVRRLGLPENRQKKVIVTFARSDRRIDMTIQDQGQGFDWRPFLEIEPSRATHGSGRGIAKANLLSFDRLTFQENGSKVAILEPID